MSFIDTIKERAKTDIKTIVLPETEDVRVLKAAEKISELSKLISKDEIYKFGRTYHFNMIAKDNNINIEGIAIVDPATSDKYEEYCNKFFELRQKKGVSIEKARETILNIFLRPTLSKAIILK